MSRAEIPPTDAGHLKASAAVTAALRTLSFPISREDAIRKVGDREIPLARETRVPLGDLLRGIPLDELDDVRVAAAAVDGHWARLARSIETIERAERAAQGAARSRVRR